MQAGARYWPDSGGGVFLELCLCVNRTLVFSIIYTSPPLHSVQCVACLGDRKIPTPSWYHSVISFPHYALYNCGEFVHRTNGIKKMTYDPSISSRTLWLLVQMLIRAPIGLARSRWRYLDPYWRCQSLSLSLLPVVVTSLTNPINVVGFPMYTTGISQWLAYCQGLLTTRSVTIFVDLVILCMTWAKIYDTKKAAAEAGCRVPVTTLLLRDGQYQLSKLWSHDSEICQ